MTSPGMPLAVVRLYQHQAGAGLKQVFNRKPQVRTCGDEENRTLNPRLANSDQTVRRCRFRSLTCADSSSKIAEYPWRASSRQHNWQHSTAVGRSHAQFRWGRIDGNWSSKGRVPR